MNTVDEILSQLARDRFYGSVEIKLEAGKIVLLRKTETIKPTDENCRNNRSGNDEHKS